MPPYSANLPLSPRALVFLLGALVAFGPLSIDMYLPALPAIGAALGVEPGAVHFTVSAFLAGFCVGMVLTGPLSDRFGRRPLLVGGLVLYVVASIACALAPGIESLIAGRFVQAVGGGAVAVTGRAVVRDVFATADSARVLSLMQIVTLVAPLVAPIVGGYLAALFGWRVIFVFLGAFGGLCFVAVLLRLPETRAEVSTPETLSMMSLLRDYARILGHGRSLALILGGAASFAGMFAYISASPFVYIDHFGVNREHFGYFFGLNAFGIMLAATINARYVRKLGVRKMLRTGGVLAMVSGVVLAVLGSQPTVSLFEVAAPLFVFVSVTGLIGANCVAQLFALHEQRAGTAAAAFGAVQFALGACVSAALGLINDRTPAGMSVAIGACGLGVVLALYVGTRAPRGADLPAAQKCPS